MLALGTVQFGMPYGVANRRGQVDLAEAKAILDHARAAGMDTLDTAMTYGTSEQSLGIAGVDRWRVVSKLPALPDPCPDVGGWVRRATEASIRRLRLSRLGALLLHAPQDLLSANGEALYAALLAVRQAGLVDKIGISIYDPQELEALAGWHFDLIQAPFNIIDRRLADSGWLDALHGAGVEIHVRSLFLQGLLLMRSDQRPGGFVRWQKIWDLWDQWLRESGLSAVEACLGSVAAHPQIDRMVVGVDGLAQLEEILRARVPDDVHPPRELSSADADLVNPSRWVGSR